MGEKAGGGGTSGERRSAIGIWVNYKLELAAVQRLKEKNLRSYAGDEANGKGGRAPR